MRHAGAVPLRPPRRVLVVPLTVLLTVLLVVAGCSGDGGDSAASSGALETRLESARSTLDKASSLSFDLEAAELPTGVTGLLEANGTGTHDPAFEGTVKVATGDSTMSADVVAVDGTVHAKLGFSPEFVPLDPASVGAPDPAALMAKSGGVSSLLTSTGNLEQGEESRDGRDVVTAIDGVLPGSTVRQLFPSADEDAEFHATYRLTEDDVLRDATIKGPFYPGGESVTYTLEVTASDKSVDITAP